MVSKGMLSMAALGIFALVAFGKNAPKVAPIPGDPLEMVAGQIQVVNTPASREAALQLLTRARSSYGLRSSGQGYDLKVTFTVNSGGQTEYDGAWEMEDVSDPPRGFRWTAKATAGYTTTQISSNGMFYGEGTVSTIPLRLQEARAALFDPIPSPQNVDRALIRTSTGTFNGAQLTCVLISGSKNAATATPGRRWEETEECIDPKSGLLTVHSQIPGRYYAYDYSNAPQLDGYVLPRKVTVTEAGKTVSEISVVSLSELPAADPSLFVPTEEMLARGPAVAMAGAQKISRVAGGKLTSGATAQPVCVFGLVTASGELVEAHSLQPSDPNSEAAVQDAKQMNFSHPTPPGARPQQHFVFVIETFVSSQ
jgi:hypothetical protein